MEWNIKMDIREIVYEDVWRSELTPVTGLRSSGVEPLGSSTRAIN
jgi:hypothetical protein